MAETTTRRAVGTRARRLDAADKVIATYPSKARPQWIELARGHLASASVFPRNLSGLIPL